MFFSQSHNFLFDAFRLQIDSNQYIVLLILGFRKTSCAGEANLTGMKFNGPAAVDVFRPKKK